MRGTAEGGVAVDQLSLNREAGRHLPSRVEKLHVFHEPSLKTASLQRRKGSLTRRSGDNFVHPRMLRRLLDCERVNSSPILNLIRNRPRIRDASMPRREGQAEITGVFGIADR